MSLRFQADADLNYDILRAVRQQEPSIDFASATDAGLRGITDAEVLERAAHENRILVSHDHRTMLHHFRSRLAEGKSSPGLLVAYQHAAVGLVTQSLVILWSVAESADLRDQAYHLPSLMRHTFPR